MTEFMPHGHCYFWSGPIIALQVTANLLIALAYLSIPATLFYFTRRRTDLPFPWLFRLFGAFILFCGLTHLMDIVTIWTPLYWLDGILRLVTAGVSLLTAAVLFPVIPMALQLRSPAELEEANAKLRQAEAYKDEFLARVSHELRTPLTLILAPVEKMLEEKNRPDAAALGLVRNNALRLLQMVNGLLDFSKLEAGKLEARREPTRIVELTRSLVHDFAPVFRQRELASDFTSRPDEIVVGMDRYLYERILFNLLSNAGKFTERGGRISVALEHSDDRLRVAVSDTGIGLASEDREKIFQKFHQVDGSSTRRFEGTGLGLPLVREFAGLLGGTVTVDSAPGQGSTFAVELPAPAVAQQPAPAVHSPALTPVGYDSSPRLSSAKPGMGMKILVAEDNPDLAKYIASLLEREAGVLVASDGEEASRLIAEWSPDLVISDVMMPRKDGLVLCREIKSSPRTLATPVILLTALTQREAMMQGWEAGADDYLFKPFHPAELQARVRAALTAIELRRTAELERNRYQAELERSNAELEEFAYVASHDLQEPLRTVTSYVQLLERRYKGRLDADADEFIRFTVESTQRMRSLIMNLLELSRVGRTSGEREPVDCDAVVETVKKHVHEAIRESGAQIEVGLLPVVMACRSLLTRLFQNLLENALKYRSPDRPARIRVEAVEEGGTWRFSVRDNGLGIEPQYHEKIFRAFQRLHSSSEFTGTGIGLAIAKKNAEFHGGRIWVESVPGEGSTFYFTLPAAQETPSARNPFTVAQVAK